MKLFLETIAQKLGKLVCRRKGHWWVDEPVSPWDDLRTCVRCKDWDLVSALPPGMTGLR